LTDPNGEAQGLVYKFANRVFSYLGTVDQATPLEIADPDDLARQATGIVVAVVNSRAERPFDGTSPVEVSFDLEESPGDQLPWSFSLSWLDFEVPSAIWASTGSGSVTAPAGTTVTVEAPGRVGSIVVRSHGGSGPVTISGSFLVAVQPPSGRHDYGDGRYAEFSFSNPRLILDDGSVVSGPDFSYEILAEDDSRGLVQGYQLDVEIRYFAADGTQTGTSPTIGAGAMMVIDYERYD
jgi:hypothetical protein